VIVVDTNVLVYAADTTSPRFEVCRRVVDYALDGKFDGVLLAQVLLEFYATITSERSQQPLPPEDAWELIEALQAGMPVLGPRAESLAVLARLVRDVRVSGQRIFDVYLAAQMRSHGVTEICTDNVKHFKFAGIGPVRPEDVLARAA
jgi:predicted nucleic acid-binding protein